MLRVSVKQDVNIDSFLFLIEETGTIFILKSKTSPVPRQPMTRFCPQPSWTDLDRVIKKMVFLQGAGKRVTRPLGLDKGGKLLPFNGQREANCSPSTVRGRQTAPLQPSAHQELVMEAMANWKVAGSELGSWQ